MRRWRLDAVPATPHAGTHGREAANSSQRASFALRYRSRRRNLFHLTHHEACADTKTHRFVKAARSSVSFAYMEKRRQAELAMLLKQYSCKPLRMTAANMIRMSANCADLSKSFQRQPLSGHGDQLAIFEMPNIRPKLPGA